MVYSFRTHSVCSMDGWLILRGIIQLHIYEILQVIGCNSVGGIIILFRVRLYNNYSRRA